MSANPSAKGAASSLRGAKSKQNKSIILKVPSKILSAFPHDRPASNSSPMKSPTSESSSTPAIAAKGSPLAAEVKPEGNTKTEVNAETATEPTLDNPSADGQPQADGKKKGLGGPKPGQKRRSGAVVDGQLKPRAKPGPKRRKLEGDEAGRPWTTPTTSGPGHKLGPKANQGAINAGLRALDRTGKPCRKWNKTGFSLKSFTGGMWALNSWATPRPMQEVNPEGAENATPNSNSENQQASSNIGSEVSHGNAAEVKPDVTSSPAPVPVSA